MLGKMIVGYSLQKPSGEDSQPIEMLHTEYRSLIVLNKDLHLMLWITNH